MKLKHILFATGCAAIVGTALFSFKPQPQDKFDLKASIERGKEIYSTHCVFCHMAEGQGVEGAFPPVAKSDYLMADKKRSIKEIIYGVTGEMKVNGVVYNGEMKPTDLNDTEVSDVLNFIRNSFGNKGEAVVPTEVKAERK
ncbi:c-type cytochrome [Foetidibacter luteolus]|uniref:c-type cytochrome n=1 Tax=Foetidibacter luteolus TaxID=2608880 RepID=UPI00129B5C67|nr:cytochrome c [Foetidibacter luteolus]